MMEPLKIDHWRYPILVVDDEINNLEVFRLQFRRKFDIHTASGAEEALALIQPGRWTPAVVVADQRMPHCTGIGLLRRLNDLVPDAIGIVLTAYSDWDVLLQALNSGLVYRYLLKPWKAQEVEIAIRQAIERHALQRANQQMLKQLSRMNEYLEAELQGGVESAPMVGEEGGLSGVMKRVEEVSTGHSPILITGEPSTGQATIARAIHDRGPRRDHPFIKVGCSTLPTEVLEEELFGVGADDPTGVVRPRIGRLELAQGGTLFLEGVSELPGAVQGRMVRSLTGDAPCLTAGGDHSPNVRIIAASHCELTPLVEGGRLIPELLGWLRQEVIELPPLRARQEDIPELVRQLVERCAAQASRPIDQVTEEAVALLVHHPWPGNLRELQNVIERAVILSRGRILDVGDLNVRLPPGSTISGDTSGVQTLTIQAGQALDQTLDQLERQRIVAALERAGGSKARAARELGLSRTTLYYRLHKHGLLNDGELT